MRRKRRPLSEGAEPSGERAGSQAVSLVLLQKAYMMSPTQGRERC
jgi:hypothetical protein